MDIVSLIIYSCQDIWLPLRHHTWFLLDQYGPFKAKGQAENHPANCEQLLMGLVPPRNSRKNVIGVGWWNLVFKGSRYASTISICKRNDKPRAARQTVNNSDVTCSATVCDGLYDIVFEGKKHRLAISTCRDSDSEDNSKLISVDISPRKCPSEILCFGLFTLGVWRYLN